MPNQSPFWHRLPWLRHCPRFVFLTHLDVSAAVRYNILAVVAVILVGWSWCVWLGRTLGKRVPDWSQWRYASWTTAVVVFVWFIIRLLPWEPFASLRV